jgi:hypothetical protein
VVSIPPGGLYPVGAAGLRQDGADFLEDSWCSVALLLRSVTMDPVTAAIVVILILVAIGTVADGLLRLRKWLNKPPSVPDLPPPLDDESD